MGERVARELRDGRLHLELVEPGSDQLRARAFERVERGPDCSSVTRSISRRRSQTRASLQRARGKEDGRWDSAYAGSRTIDEPDDLAKALDANPKARAFFAALDSANRYSVLFRVHTAKKAETRAARIEKLVAMLGRGEKIHP